jgi:hypothetical protein
MRLGYFVPAYGGHVRSELLNTMLHDYTHCLAAGIEFRFFAHDVQPVDRARNLAVQRARELECQWLFMLDADVWADPSGSPLEQLFDTLADTGACAAAAVVPTRAGVLNVEPVKPHQRYACDKIGTAMMLLDLARLDALAPGHTWFRYQLDDDGIGVRAGEDVFFCREVQRLGGTVVANYQIPTRHLGSVPLAIERVTRDG